MTYIELKMEVRKFKNGDKFHKFEWSVSSLVKIRGYISDFPVSKRLSNYELIPLPSPPLPPKKSHYKILTMG